MYTETKKQLKTRTMNLLLKSRIALTDFLYFFFCFQNQSNVSQQMGSLTMMMSMFSSMGGAAGGSMSRNLAAESHNNMEATALHGMSSLGFTVDLLWIYCVVMLCMKHIFI